MYNLGMNKKERLWLNSNVFVCLVKGSLVLDSKLDTSYSCLNGRSLN